MFYVNFLISLQILILINNNKNRLKIEIDYLGCCLIKELNKLYPHKEFIDLARVFDGKSKGNVDGICW